MFNLEPEEIQNHTHNGVDSDKLDFNKAIKGAPRAAITRPTGGVTIDAEARLAINHLITALEDLKAILTQ